MVEEILLLVLAMFISWKLIQVAYINNLYPQVQRNRSLQLSETELSPSTTFGFFSP